MSDFQGFDDFQFPEDENGEFGNELDDNEFPDVGAEDEEMPSLAEEESERRGNRTFVLLAIVMVILFVIGLLAVLFLATRQTGPNDTDKTVTAVVAFNATQSEFANMTLTANAILGITQTYIIEHPSLTPTPTNTVLPTVTPTPTIDSTIQAATQSVEMTGTALAITQTVGAMSQSQQETLIAGFTQTAIANETLNPVAITTSAPATISIDQVNQTATALVGFFLTATAQANQGGGGGTEIATGGPSPTVESFGPTATPGLPNTGIFDDVAGGGRGGVGLMALAAFGLVGVIFVSRRLRSRSDK